MPVRKTPFAQTDLGRGLMTTLFDIVLIAIGLLIFALFHHVLPGGMDDEVIVIPVETVAPVAEDDAGAPPIQETPTQETPAQDAPEATPAPEAATAAAIQPGVFTDGGIVKTETTYKTADVSIEMTHGRANNANYHVADIYLRDATFLHTAFAKGKAETGHTETVPSMAKNNGAILATNGDYFGTHKKGLVIREGVVYRQKMDDDACVLYMDGTMEIYTKANFDIDTVVAKKPYQAWSFGPSLLNADGSKIVGFTHSVAPNNPRTAIGYYAPGHYCLVTVDGRQDDSSGMTLTELSALMEQLGCVKAYNLDGGRSSVMIFNASTANNPYKGGRASSDIIYIAESEG